MLWGGGCGGGTGCERESALSAPQPLEQFPGSGLGIGTPKLKVGMCIESGSLGFSSGPRIPSAVKRDVMKAKGPLRWDGGKGGGREANPHKGVQ